MGDTRYEQYDMAEDWEEDSGGQEEETDDGSIQKQKHLAESIEKSGSVTQSNGKYTIHCLTIIGQVEGRYILPSQNKTTKYEHVIPQLVAIEEDPAIQGLLVLLNTVGGEIGRAHV